MFWDTEMLTTIEVLPKVSHYYVNNDLRLTFIQLWHCGPAHRDPDPSGSRNCRKSSLLIWIKSLQPLTWWGVTFCYINPRRKTSWDHPLIMRINVRAVQLCLKPPVTSISKICTTSELHIILPHFLHSLKLSVIRAFDQKPEKHSW